MVKRLITLILAGIFSLSLTGIASSSSIDELEERIDELEETIESMEENAEKWELSSRIQLNGDYRFSFYWNEADTTTFWLADEVADAFAMFLSAGKSMERWFEKEGRNPTLKLEDFMEAYDSDLLARQSNNFVSSEGDSLMSSKELDTFATFMDAGLGTGEIYGVLSARFPYNLGQQVVLFTSPQNMANFFDGKYDDPEDDDIGENSVIGPHSGLVRQQRLNILHDLNFKAKEAATYKNDSILLNRFRLNLRAKATENVEVKARFSVYKAWGMQSNPIDRYNDPNPGGFAQDHVSRNYGPYLYSTMDFDGSNTRVPLDNTLKVDRMFANWNNVFDMPLWFSAGRRPTTDGPPSHFKLGADKRMATPMANMDYPFDGISVGYAWADPWPGRARWCFGRGFESGSTIGGQGVNDVDFTGFAFDLYKKDNAFLYFQIFGAFNMMNVPDNVSFRNPLEEARGRYNDDAVNNFNSIATFTEEEVGNGVIDVANIGNVYHADYVFYNATGNWDYFISGGWSRTDPKGYDEVGVGLLSIWWDPNVLEEKDGFNVYTGARYTMEDLGIKVGAEFNWGSKNWISFTPGHDDLYASKLAVRGWATEVYGIWNIPSGEAISKFGKAFFRVGWIHYNYDYTRSGFWLGPPEDVDNLDDPFKADFNAPVKTADSIYITYEAWF